MVSGAAGKKANHRALDRAGALNFIIWSTTEPAVALICACLPITRSLLASYINKISSSFNNRSWFCLGRSPSPGSTRIESPLPSNRYVTHIGSVSQDVSRKENLVASQGSIPSGNPRSLPQYITTRDSTCSETYPMTDTYRLAETHDEEKGLAATAKGEEGSEGSESWYDKV